MLVTLQQDDTVASNVSCRHVKLAGGTGHYLVIEGTVRMTGSPDIAIRFLADDEGHAVRRYNRMLTGMRLVT